MSFGNVPADLPAGAVEKLLARMDESDLATFYTRELPTMPPDVVHAFIEALFDAFRDRGESSEDAAEEAGTTLDAISSHDRTAIATLLAYARTSPDLLKGATGIFVERRPDLVEMLPAALRDAIAERLTRSLS
jgi:hypothetical protein